MNSRIMLLVAGSAFVLSMQTAIAVASENRVHDEPAQRKTLARMQAVTCQAVFGKGSTRIVVHCHEGPCISEFSGGPCIEKSCSTLNSSKGEGCETPASCPAGCQG